MVNRKKSHLVFFLIFWFSELKRFFCFVLFLRYAEVDPKGSCCSDHLSLFLCVGNPNPLRPGWKRRAIFSFVLLNQSGQVLFRSSGNHSPWLYMFHEFVWIWMKKKNWYIYIYIFFFCLYLKNKGNTVCSAMRSQAGVSRRRCLLPS